MVLSLDGLGQDKLQAYFSYSTFYAPGKGPYIETYLSVNGKSAVYAKNDDDKTKARIEVTYIFMQGEVVKQFDKYELQGPELKDSLSPKINFIDQQRIALLNGEYKMIIKIKDLNSDKDGFSSEQKVKVSFDTDSMAMSSIELVEKYSSTITKGPFTKSGIDIIPNISNFYPETKNEILFYSEIYNSDKELNNEKFLIKYYIADYQTLEPNPNFIGYIRQNPSKVGIVLRKFNIEKLKTGNYFLIIEIRDKNNVLQKNQSIFLQRHNPKMDVSKLLLKELDISSTFVNPYFDLDTLVDYVRSVRPIADMGEQKFIDNQTKRKAEPNVLLLKQFLYNFWKVRNSLDPDSDWGKYQFEVEKVNSTFGTSIKRGYQTDRGRTYLKYGPPNSRMEVPSEPNSYPYEIWQYNRIGNQSNGRFVFYDSDLITNDFELLHSTVFGELQNYRWEMILQKRNTNQNDLDQTDPGNSIGSRASDYFNQPR
jgi:GWxTD domain-containing protein|tara:strand:+ start:5618 stop:7057 length:1440 start_codon:yes stop_codon:yes gene_type:complete